MPDLDLSLNELAARNKAIWQMDAAGLSPAQRAMPALVHRNAYAPAADQTRVLLVGGLSGRQADVYLVLDALRNYLAGGDGLARSVALSAVPCGNPDGRETGGVPRNSAGGNPASGYPPQDNFFFDKQNPEARYLWRWIGFQAPDLLLEVRAGDQVAWEATPGATSVIPNSRPMAVDDSLLAALSAGKPNGVGTVPGLRLTAPRHALTAELARLWQSLARASKLPLSPARRTLDTRRRRTPLEIARLLSSVYGHKLDPVTYTQGVSVSGRLRLAKLDPQDRATVPDVVKLVEPYASGAREVFTGRVAPGSFNGLAWAQELTQATGDRRYADMLVSAANRYQAGASGGAPPPSDPDFRTEDMFMNGSI
ncbi:MAG: hypothetical protein FJ316_08395 [SAR202 cluster bacterium]|nr:hypothetical protein [SAR202 cluster bacterium]